MNKRDLTRRYTILLAFTLSAILAGCQSITLVQPYDADLYKNTESFYKKTSLVISKGMSVSPMTPAEVRSIPPGKEVEHPGHYSQFEDDYNDLIVESNALIIRSLANSGDISQIGQDIQMRVESAITETLPSECDDLQGNFPNVSLTTRNYIDLKCLIGRWQNEHQGLSPEGDTTGGKLILKKANWEGRSKSLFGAILAIQKGEASKKPAN